LHHGLARRAGVLREEVATPEKAIGAHVETGDLVRAGDGFDEGAGVIHIGPAEAVDVVVAHGEPAPERGPEQREHGFDHGRRGHGIHVRDGVFETQLKRAREFGKRGLYVAQRCHVKPVDEPEFSVGGVFQAVADALAVGLPQPLLLGHFLEAGGRHALAGSDAEAREERIGLDRFADRGAEIRDRVGRRFFVGETVFAGGSEHEDVPGEEIDVHAPILRELHHVAPEADFFVDGDFFDDLVLRQHRGRHEIVAVAVEVCVEPGGGAPDIVECDLGELRDFHDARKGIQRPQRDHVVTVAGHIAEELPPKIQAPHFREVGLRGVAGIGVAGRAEIERDIEFDAALRDVRGVGGILERIQSAGADRFGEIEAAIHDAGGIAAVDRDGRGAGGASHDDGITLGHRRRARARTDGERDADGICRWSRIVGGDGDAAGGGFAANFPDGEATGLAGRGVERD
jgi:hypothetical protein